MTVTAIELTYKQENLCSFKSTHQGGKTYTLQLRSLENDDDDKEKPYWDDAIDKYFSHPKTDEFRSMTYPEYFKNYNLKITPPSQSARQSCTRNQNNHYVIKRKKPLLLRFVNYKVEDSKL